VDPFSGRLFQWAAISSAHGAIAGFGPHLFFNGFGCLAGGLEDTDRIYALLDSLPARIGMTKIMPPYVFRPATPGRGGDGISGFVLIADSHIALHAFPRRHFLNVEVFSCQAFDVELLLAAFKQHFVPRRVEWKLLDRALEFPKTVAAARARVLRCRAMATRDLGLEASR
jgi:S-adenosylmethionine decarboxylase